MRHMAAAAILHAPQKIFTENLEMVSGLFIPAFVKMYKTCAPDEEIVKLRVLVLRCLSLFSATASVSGTVVAPSVKRASPSGHDLKNAISLEVAGSSNSPTVASSAALNTEDVHADCFDCSSR